MEEPKYWGFYSDDGEKLNPNLYPKPQLCLSCKKNDEGGEEEMLCTLTRLDQRNSKNFYVTPTRKLKVLVLQLTSGDYQKYYDKQYVQR